RALRTIAVLVTLALVSETAAADSGPTGDRAGQKMGPSQAQQERARRIRLVRFAQWQAQQDRGRELRRLTELIAEREADAAAQDADPPR
ncbi:MAG: hypothetical protein J2P46_17345, partial [Zavarzinella sp.]|nr:hypothetical protein [Zavarzinella sp.]